MGLAIKSVTRARTFLIKCLEDGEYSESFDSLNPRMNGEPPLLFWTQQDLESAARTIEADSLGTLIKWQENGADMCVMLERRRDGSSDQEVQAACNCLIDFFYQKLYSSINK